MATGANTAPLGQLHPILAARGGSNTPTSNEPLGSKQAVNNPELRAHLEAAKRAASMLFSEEPAKKKRRSRWGGEESRTILPGLPTVLPPNLSEPQQKLYLLHLRIEDLSRRLRTDDLGISLNPLDRSPSPEPIYSTDGKRLNTREFRARKKLEDDRHDSIQAALAINPEYKPPIDYKAPTKKFEDKIFIPQDEHPLTNFVGLLIGPRGNTLKQLEKETNCKIMIRGKGATKQGKYNPMGIPQPGEDEELHALLTATSPEDLKVGMDKVHSIIKSGIENPGNENDLKRMQMMQLAELNGTFRPIDILKCSNCGSTTHRTWECSESQNVTSSIICTRCGGGGHVALDCKVDLSTLSEQPSVVEKAKMDSEYQSLMKELGEPVPEKQQQDSTSVGYGSTGSGSVAYPPPDSLVGGNNPGGVQIQDPSVTANTAQWPPPMMAVPHPGGIPFPILLPPQAQVPPPWMGVPMPPPGAMMGTVPGMVMPQGSVPVASIPSTITPPINQPLLATPPTNQPLLATPPTNQPLLGGDTSVAQSTSSLVPPLISSSVNTSSAQTSEAAVVMPLSSEGAVSSQPPSDGVVPPPPPGGAVSVPLLPVPIANPPGSGSMIPPPPPPPPQDQPTHAPPPPPPSEPPPPPPPS